MRSFSYAELFKYFLYAIGGGAGAAWPLFGIVSAALNFSVGSFFALIFSAICSLIFLIVVIVLTIIGWHEYKSESKINEKRYKKAKNSFLSALFQLQFSGQEVSENNKLSKKKHILFQKYQPYQINEINIPIHVPSILYIKTRAVVFFAVFGSIAGCGAGLSGLLTTVGVFRGLNAVPAAGWGLLIIAFICALILSGVCTHYEYHRIKKERIADMYIKAAKRISIYANTNIEKDISSEKETCKLDN